MLQSLWHKIRPQKKEQLLDSKQAFISCLNGIDTANSLSLGKAGEDFVALFLTNHHYIIKEKNYRARAGEIDLIAQKNDVLAFVEVKLRTKPCFSMTELIVPSKQKKIIKTAESYIIRNGISNMVLRFDVALISLENNIPSFTYIPNAFTDF